MHLVLSPVKCRAHANVRICSSTGSTNKPDSTVVRGHPATQQHPGPDSLVSATQSQQSLDERRRNDLGLTSSLLQLGPVSTGFPLPLWYSAGPEPDSDTKDDTARDRYLRRLRDAPDNTILYGLQPEDEATALQPVFRAAPYRAEMLRRAQKSTSLKILFLEEGNACRSVIAEALTLQLLAVHYPHLDVSAQAASIGPCTSDVHEPYVQNLAQEAGLDLPPRACKQFDELGDIVAHDLVLVMDDFDFQEVFREVAVFDRINRAGSYAARVQKLGSFAAPSRKKAVLQQKQDIFDPLWSTSRQHDYRMAAMWATLRQLRLACTGLLAHLDQLNARLEAQQTLAAAMAAQLVKPQAWLQQGPARDGSKCAPVQPVWLEMPRGVQKASWEAARKPQLYTIRERRGSSDIVLASRSKGYWQSLSNVERELRAWMRVHRVQGALPTSVQLREAGAWSLMYAVRLHGPRKLAARLGLKGGNHPVGHWDKFENLAAGLADWLLAKHCEDLQQQPRAARLSAQFFEASGAVPEPSEVSSYSFPPGATMPSYKQLVQGGRSDLAGAVQRWGGAAEVAKRLGLPCGIRPRRLQPITPSQLRQELYAAVPGMMRAGLLPTRGQLQDAGACHAISIIRALGGYRKTAELLRLSFNPRTSRC